MNRAPGSRSRDLRFREFGTAGPGNSRKRKARPADYRWKSSRGKPFAPTTSTKIGLE